MPTEVEPTIEWIDDAGRFERLGEEWDGLLGDDARPFDLHCWYLSWWEAFGAGRELAICAARVEGRLVGVLPMSRRGSQLAALANAHTPVFRPLASNPRVVKALLRAATEAGATELAMPALPANERSIELLRDGSVSAMIANLDPGPVSPIVDTGGDFEEWRKQSKRRWGAPLERFRRKMIRDNDAQLEIVETPSDLERELEEGFRVEASGWKGEQGTAILSSLDTLAFYRSVAERFHAREELRLSRVVLDGELAAFDLCLLHRGRLYLLKTGFDERFRRLAPGLVMRLSVVERCFELGLEAHELLGDDTEWKRKFATGERRHLTLQAYSRRPVGLARYAYRARLRPQFGRVYRRLRPRRRSGP